jgi:DNA-3-methyladenine glycosylase II
VTAAAASTFAIDRGGPFSLQLAAGFGFGPEEGKAPAREPVLRLAFLLDDLATHTAVTLRQDAPDHPVQGALHPDAAGTADATAAQVARILSLDHDASAYAALGDRDPVLAPLLERHYGLRPVLFHSPYEAAAWALISHRRPAAQAAVARARLAQELGATFAFDDDNGQTTLDGFPTPERLLTLQPDQIPGLPAVQVERLHALARATLDGRLQPRRLREELEPGEALADLQELPGIGPFWATLILVRSTGATDVLPADEPRLQRAVQKAYNLPEPPEAAALATIAEAWRPFRTWACVLLRYVAQR